MGRGPAERVSLLGGRWDRKIRDRSPGARLIALLVAVDPQDPVAYNPQGSERMRELNTQQVGLLWLVNYPTVAVSQRIVSS